jgi:hypothetical protein
LQFKIFAACNKEIVGISVTYLCLSVCIRGRSPIASPGAARTPLKKKLCEFNISRVGSNIPFVERHSGARRAPDRERPDARAASSRIFHVEVFRASRLAKKNSKNEKKVNRIRRPRHSIKVSNGTLAVASCGQSAEH